MTVQYGRVISIPSGTIKSVLARERSESEQDISIPSGTIKSMHY